MEHTKHTAKCDHPERFRVRCTTNRRLGYCRKCGENVRDKR